MKKCQDVDELGNIIRECFQIKTTRHHYCRTAMIDKKCKCFRIFYFMRPLYATVMPPVLHPKNALVLQKIKNRTDHGAELL